MKSLRTACLLSFITFCTVHFSHGQVTVGVYSNGILTQIGIGTDPERKFFGEGRIFAGDYINNFLGVEALGQYNLKYSEWHNISAGLMVGYYDYVEGIRIGIPVLLAIKPVESHRNFSVILEATPMYTASFALRGNLGVRYTIGNRQ
jgi:hypothetical protein